MDDGPRAQDADDSLGTRAEIARALHNGAKLGLSLLSTLAVAFAVRFWLPRAVGPDDFGRLTWAEAFATAAFVFVNLGVDMYVRREVSVRPAHAGDFYGGVVVLRVAFSIVVLAAMAIALQAMGKGVLDARLAYLFAAGQLAVCFTNTQGALLNAIGHIDELAILNVLCKLMWAAAIFAGISSGWGLDVVAVAFTTTEIAKALLYHRVLSRRMQVPFKVDLRAAWTVVVVSLPYFLNLLCHSVYERVGVNFVSVLSTDAEVGYYGAAVNVASMMMLFMPIVGLVLMPMSMRLQERSIEQANEAMRGALRVVVVVCLLPATLMFAHADAIATLLFGAPFLPAGSALRVLAPMVPITYVAVVAALQINMQGRIWTLVKVSAAGLVVNPIVAALLIPRASTWGPGAPGAAAAFSALATEVVVAALLLAALGRAALDGTTLRTLGKGFALAAGVLVVDAVVPWRGLWWAPVEGAAYLGAAIAWGALPWRRLLEMVRARRVVSAR